MDRYEVVNSEPQRLPGHREARGSRSGLPGWALWLMAAVSVLAGVLMLPIGLGLLAIEDGDLKGPRWLLAAFGGVMVGAGLMMAAMAVRQRAAERRRTAGHGLDARSVALGDRDWDESGENSRAWPRALSALAGTLFLTLFLSVFNWWALKADSPWMVKLIVGLFDLLLLVAWWQTALLIGRALKFGASRIAFARFPCPPDGPIVIRWVPPSGIGQAHKGSFALRCVKEWKESRGSGKNRSVQLIHEEQWCAQWLLERSREFPPGRAIDLQFEPPEGLPSTRLNAESPVFWEFEARLDLPGFDFEERYLVPVYAPWQSG